jgi:predicted nucleic acid-binding protein
VGGDSQLGPAPPRGTHQLAVPHCGTARDEAVAATWGRLSAAAVRRGRPRPVNDMWGAACCLTHGIPLATFNLKDYEDFNQHHGLRILGRE